MASVLASPGAEYVLRRGAAGDPKRRNPRLPDTNQESRRTCPTP